MKFIYILSFVSFISWSTEAKGQNIPQFDNDVNSIYSEVEPSLFNKDQLDDLKNETEQIVSDIEYFIKRNANLTTTQTQELNLLKKEAVSLEDFLSVIGDGS